MNDRFDYVDGSLDDAVVEGVNLFRLESLSDGLVWIRLYRDNAPDIVIHISTDSDRLAISHSED